MAASSGRISKPDDWGWTGELTAADLRIVAPISRQLILHGSDWVNRRVETIELLDDRSVRIQTSVDFRVPVNLPEGLKLAGDEVHLLPLTWLERRNDLAFFDIRSEDGSALPLLSRRENGRLTGMMLVDAAREALAGS